MDLKKIKNTTLILSFYALIFIYFIIFFTKLHPITISDTDDWTYLFINRKAIPLWKNWNPIRILPEVLMPLISEISTYILGGGDFFKSLTLGYAFVLAALITILVIALCRYLYNEYNIELYVMICAMVFFILCHFWIFRTANSGNNYMFKTIDACTHFFYVIPNIMNCILVVWMMKIGTIKRLFLHEEWHGAKGFFVVFAYFCIFSNIWASIIAVSFIGAKLLLELVCELKKHKFRFSIYIKNNLGEVVFLIVWITSQIYEINGGRSNSLQASSNPYKEEFFNTLKILWNTIKGMNTRFIACIIILFILGLFFIVKEKERKKLKQIIILLLSFIITGLYLIFSCAKAVSWYISRADVFYGLFFFGMMIEILCFLAVIEHLSFLKILMPLLLIIIFSDCNTNGKTFLESNTRQLDPGIVAGINNDILQQMLDAQKERLDATNIYVPLFNSNDNWPYATYANSSISGSLYKLGVLNYNVQITKIIPTEEKNKELHIIIK